MNTLYLVPETWDLTLDSSANIALAAPPWQLAQDAASAIKTFQGEVWYDTQLGIPYFQDVLGEFPPLELLKALFVDAALTVPGVVAAQAFIASFQGRQIRGQVQVTDVNGVITPIGF